MEVLSSSAFQFSSLNGFHPPSLLPLPLLPPFACFMLVPHDLADAELEEERGGASQLSPSLPRFDITVSWRPPPDGWIKLNTDGSFVGRDSSGGVGFVARDSEGLFVFAGASSCPGVNPLFSELWAIRSALTEAIKAGFPRVILESDSSSAVQLLGGVSKMHLGGRNSWCRSASPFAAAFAKSSFSLHTARAIELLTDSLRWAAGGDGRVSSLISTS